MADLYENMPPERNPKLPVEAPTQVLVARREMERWLNLN